MEIIIALVVIGLLVIGISNYFIGLYNRIIVLRNNVLKSFANIDVLLKQRADEIPNLVEAVRGYQRYESETFERIIQLRSQYLDAKDFDEKVNVSNHIGKALQSLIALAESYPDLKASASFLELQTRISALENHIADRREFYNESANMYNIAIEEFPALVVARMMQYKRVNMLYFSEEEIKYDGIQF